MTDLDTIHTLTETLHISATLNKFEKNRRIVPIYINTQTYDNANVFYYAYFIYRCNFQSEFFSNSRVPMDSYSVDTSVALAPIRIDSDVNKTC